MLQNRYKTMNGGGGGQTGVSVAAAPDGLRRTPEPLEVAAPPPRRSVSVNHLARQLQSHTRVSPQVMVTPSKQFNHNNNRPFSYLSPQVTEHLVAGAASDEDEGLGIDATYKPRQVSFSNKYRQVLFNEDDYPKARYEDDLPVRNGYEDDFPKKRYDDEYPKKRYDDDLPKKRIDDDLTPKKRYDDVPLKKYEFGQRVSSSSGGGRYTSDHSSRDVVDSGIENDHPKYRTRTSERTSSRVSERTPSRVSTLRRETPGRESPAMPSARLVQQASKGGSPRRRSLSILDEQDAMENDRDNNNRTKTLETKEKKKRKLRLKNFFIRDKNKNNSSSNEEQKEVKTSTLKRAIIRTKSSHDPSDTDQASCDELKPLPQQPVRSSSSSQQQQQQQQRRPVKRSSSMHATHAPPPAPSSRRAASRSGSSVLDAPKLSWFKTVDRFTFRTNKNNNSNSSSSNHKGGSSSNGSEAHVQRRHRRAYDDTDPESAPEPATTLERRHFKPRQKPSSGSSSGGPSGARRGVQQRQNRLLANSSEESENEPKPMYLHNAAVGDIPGRFGPRRTVSREELAAAHKPTRNLSRSFSVLAPWRPSRYQGNPEIYYQNEGSERYLTKPPRGPNRMTASIESLGGSGSSLERGRTPKYKSRTNVNGL